MASQLSGWSRAARIAPFRSLVLVLAQQSQPGNHGCCHWTFGTGPAAASVVLHDASTPRIHRASTDDRPAAHPAVARAVLHLPNGCRCLHWRLHDHTLAHVPEYRNLALVCHPANVHATIQRGGVNLYPSTDHRGPKTRLQWEHTRGHSLSVLGMLAALFAHGGEVLAGMWALIQRERWAPQVRWRA